MRKRIFVLVLLTLSLAPGAAQAQPRTEITLFSEANYRGQAFTLSGSRESISLRWIVRSARVQGRDAWDLCTRTQFRAPCNRLSSSSPNIRWVVTSVRRIPAVQPPAAAGRSLRGANAEFFTAPSDANGRVQSCVSGAAACMRESADRFCRAEGWTGSSYARQETLNRRNFLADVLCTRTGR
jgi:hypothetical protein